MTFKVGRVLTDTEQSKIDSLIEEVHEKTTGAKPNIKDASRLCYRGVGRGG